jgi:D-alanyl-D-alanine dipeptidase
MGNNKGKTMKDEQNFKTKILTYSELCSVQTIDTGDDLIEMQAPAKSLLPIELSDVPHPFVRQEVWNRLVKAAKTLQAIDSDYVLRIWYAYRPLSIQTAWFNEQYTKLRKKFPLLSEFEIMDKAHLLVAVPDVAGHPTGAALDLTISKNGKDLHMGCAYLDFDSGLAPVFCDEISENQMTNRMLLRKVMIENEFAPFNGEWWHFSYGDKEWAAFWNRSHALFDVIEATPENSISRQLSTNIAIYDCNPGGNYTYIVHGPHLERDDYRYLDQAIRTAYAHFEQGGFIESPTKNGCVLRLHMAGGEFCANATRSLAALIFQDYLGNRNLAPIANYSLIAGSSQLLRFAIEISGVDKALLVCCSKYDDGYMVKAEMPFLSEFSNIAEKQIILQNQSVKVIVVKLQGIVHILLDEAIFPFVESPDKQAILTGIAIKQCQLQEESAVGLIWYSLTNPVIAINPIVWVRDIKTCIYESACGSGSLALAMQLLKNSPSEEKIYNIKQPSGLIIKVAISKSNDKSEFTNATIEGAVSIIHLPNLIM